MEGGGQPEKRATLNLCFDRIWIDVHAAVNRTDDPLDLTEPSAATSTSAICDV